LSGRLRLLKLGACNRLLIGTWFLYYLPTIEFGGIDAQTAGWVDTRVHGITDMAAKFAFFLTTLRAFMGKGYRPIGYFSELAVETLRLNHGFIEVSKFHSRKKKSGK
jgi:hypothetical protein